MEKSMSITKFPLIALCAALMAGCNDNAPNITIPAGSRIFIKANHLDDTLTGKVLPTEWKAGNFEKSEYNFSQVLVESNCSFEVAPQWDSRVKRLMADKGTLTCDGAVSRELPSYLVDDQGMVGRNGVAVGDIIAFVISSSVAVE